MATHAAAGIITQQSWVVREGCVSAIMPRLYPVGVCKVLAQAIAQHAKDGVQEHPNGSHLQLLVLRDLLDF